MTPKKKPLKKKDPPSPNNKKPPTAVYKVHEQSFDEKPTLIVCHTQGGCPLVGLCNLLLLRQGGTTVLNTLKHTDGTRYVNPQRLKAFVSRLLVVKLLEKVEECLMSIEERDNLLKEYEAQLDMLLSEPGLYPHLRSVWDFSSVIKAPKDLFIRLDVTRQHALIPDPKETLLYNVVKDQCSVVLLKEYSDYKAGCEKGDDYAQSYHEKMSLVIRFFMDNPDFTSYGLGRLREEAIENELFLLYLKMDLHVMYKKDGLLYLLAAEEYMLAKHPDIMWLGLDENFDFENPLETAMKLTRTFTPVNESSISISTKFLQELEEGKRGPERETETAKTTSLQTMVDTDDNSCDTAVSHEEILQTKGATQVETSEDSEKTAQRLEIVVGHRFLRFLNRCVVSFKEFISSYDMFKIYHFQGQKFSSASHLGRVMAKGFLLFIFRIHKSDFSWNGDFKEEHMFLELELVDGYIGEINCFITLTANMGFNKKHGEADLQTYVQILFPAYLCEGIKQLPFYFQSFEVDIRDMPDHGDPPEKFEQYYKYMSEPFFAKAPLVISTLVSSVYGIGDSEIVHTNQNKPKPRYGPLDIQLPYVKLSLSDLLKNLYVGSRIETHIIESNKVTCWDVIELGRHSKQHLMQYTLDNGVQQMDDPAIGGLIVEKDLCGLLTQAIKVMINNNMFKGRFESSWEEFCGSEPKDDGAKILLPSFICRPKDEKVEVAQGQEARPMQTAATVAWTQPERFILNDHGMKLTEKGLRSLEGINWVEDQVISYAYCQLSKRMFTRDELSKEDMPIKDFLLVLPNVAHSLSNLPEGSNPLQVLDPCDSNMFLFPVNNSVEHERADSGTHWSLVVLHVDRTRNKCTFVHHDSVENMNQDAAERLVRNVKKLFPTFQSTIREGTTPQQGNGYDCGVYVITISTQIAGWYRKLKNGHKVAEDWIEEVNKVGPDMVTKMRQTLFEKLEEKFPSPDLSRTHVWYATFGSNMWKPRFLCYIQGGKAEGMSIPCYGSRDTSSPSGTMWRTVHHRLLFGRSSTPCWGTGGVAFLNPEINYKETSYVCMYKITLDQFNDILFQENCLVLEDGKDGNVVYPDFPLIGASQVLFPSSREAIHLEPIKDSWYSNILFLGDQDGLPILTMTCPSSDIERYKSGELPLAPPSKTYTATLIRGLVEGEQLDADEAATYVNAAAARRL